jgi:hypothetical protein
MRDRSKSALFSLFSAGTVREAPPPGKTTPSRAAQGQAGA